MFEEVKVEDGTVTRLFKSYDVYIEAHDIELKEKAHKTYHIADYHTQEMNSNIGYHFNNE